MRWFRNRKTKTKLLVGFSVIAALLVFFCFAVLRGVGSVKDNLASMYRNRLVPITRAATVWNNMLRTRTEALTHVISRDQGEMQGIVDHIEKLDAKIDSELRNYEVSMPTDGVEKQALDEFKKHWADFKQGRDKQTLALSSAGKKAEAMAAAAGGVGTSFRHASDALEALFAINVKVASRVMDAGMAEYDRVWWMTVIVLITGVGLAVILGLLIARLISWPLGRAVEVLNSAATGDLSMRLEVDSEDEMGRMAAALNQALAAMSSTAREIALNAHILANSSEDLASSMAAQVAHEINNPLAGISSSFHLVKNAIPKDYAYYAYVGRIEKEVDRIAAIVRQLLFDLSRRETNPAGPVYSGETLGEIVSMLDSKARQLQSRWDMPRWS